MFGIGGGELFAILLVALLFFGPSKIPEIARSLGKLYRELTRVRRQVGDTLSELRQEIDLNLDLDDPAPPLRPPSGERSARGAAALRRPASSLPVPPDDDYLTADVPPDPQSAAVEAAYAAQAQPADPSDYLAGGGA